MLVVSFAILVLVYILGMITMGYKLYERICDSSELTYFENLLVGYGISTILGIVIGTILVFFFGMLS